MTDNKVIYHGGKEIIRFPEIRTAKYNKDFYFASYCTYFKKQAERRATRYGRTGVVNEYSYTSSQNLRTLVFSFMTEEWLNFIVSCRSGKPHNYDIIESPMADDTIFNYIQGSIDGEISRVAFWELAKFKRPTHQISFHTAHALATLNFLLGYEMSYDDE